MFLRKAFQNEESASISEGFWHRVDYLVGENVTWKVLDVKVNKVVAETARYSHYDEDQTITPVQRVCQELIYP